mmetsp:Transcript_54376/g.115476  ORF Transcript_54376/g.115476 Transcript_54376/m.115476 type:complete len:213 (-) Transcript_54376:1563-2201(-)
MTMKATLTMNPKLTRLVTASCFILVVQLSSRSSHRTVSGSSASRTSSTCSPRKSRLGLILCVLFRAAAMDPTVILVSTCRCAPSVSKVQKTRVARYSCWARPWIRALSTVSLPTSSGIPGVTRDLNRPRNLRPCSILAPSSDSVSVFIVAPSFNFSSMSNSTSLRSVSAFTSRSLSIVTVQHVRCPPNRLSKNSFHSSGSVASAGGFHISME